MHSYQSMILEITLLDILNICRNRNSECLIFITKKCFGNFDILFLNGVASYTLFPVHSGVLAITQPVPNFWVFGSEAKCWASKQISLRQRRTLYR